MARSEIFKLKLLVHSCETVALGGEHAYRCFLKIDHKWEIEIDYLENSRSLHTLNINASNLFLHRTGVDLAHIAATVRFAKLANSQTPRSHVFVHYTDA